MEGPAETSIDRGETFRSDLRAYGRDGSVVDQSVGYSFSCLLSLERDGDAGNDVEMWAGAFDSEGSARVEYVTTGLAAPAEYYWQWQRVEDATGEVFTGKKNVLHLVEPIPKPS